jgi:hypothetical protein
MAYGVAPKIQSTNMQPRQAAMNRALQKPKPVGGNNGGRGGGGGRGKKKGPLQTNTAYGLSQTNHLNENPDYTKNPPNFAGVNAQNQPAVNPTFVPPGTVQPPTVTPPGTTGGFQGYQPVGTGDPELDKYLAGDDVFQGILASLNRNRQMNEGSLAYNQNNLTTDNATIQRRLAEQEQKDNKLLDDDYAARGLFGSGLFAKADVDLGQSYSGQYTDLATNFQRNLQQLLSDAEGQNAMDEETLRQAQQDAITRRAQEFGIFGGPNNSTGKDKDKNKNKDKNKDKGGKGVKKGGRK